MHVCPFWNLWPLSRSCALGRIFDSGQKVVHRTGKRWNQKALERLNYNDIAKMALDELVNVASALQGLVKRRKSSIKKAGLFSHALDKLEASFRAEQLAGIKASPFARITRKKDGELILGASFSGAAGVARLTDNAFRYLDFIQSMTSTVQGIKSVNASQDSTIFGTNENGEPLYVMGDDERKFFWEIVDEFRANPTSKVYDYYSFLDSGIIEMWRNPETRPDTLQEAVNMVNQLAGGYFFDPDKKSVLPVSQYRVGYRPYAGKIGGVTNAQQRQNLDFLMNDRRDLTHAEPRLPKSRQNRKHKGNGNK